MFYTSNFLTFDRDEMYRKVFYTFNFLERKISLTSKMFYFIYPPVNYFALSLVKFVAHCDHSKFTICSDIDALFEQIRCV